MTVWARRAHANGLGDDPAHDVTTVVRRVVALQGQDVAATRLAVRARSAGLTAADVDDAVARGDVVRTWAMRGTLHLVAADDLRWLTAIFGPYFRDRQRPRRRQLGLTDEDCERGVAQLEHFLTEPRTRAEIVEHVDLALEGQAAPYFLAFAAFSGVICRGPERGREPTYVLAPDLGPAGDQLAVRYLQGHGPASPADLAAWSGLPLGRARAMFDDVRDLLEPDGDGFRLREVPEATGTRLLGHFDAFLLGYRERNVPAEHARVLQTGGGFVMPAVSAAGRLVGTWRLSTQDVLAVTTFTAISARVRREIQYEVADLGRFLGRTITLGDGDSAGTS